MEIKKAAIAGTLESSDVQILIEPNPDNKIQIILESPVKTIFGDAIEKTVRQTLDECGVDRALVIINDKGALDFTIRARTQCAVCRATETRFDWGKEDPNDKE